MDLFARLSQPQILQQRFGKVSLTSADNPTLLLIEPSGYIGPSLLKKTLEIAAEFGRQHPQGWDYIVDPLHLSFPNPLNIIWLRKIPDLPNLRKYIVIAPPSFLIRLLEKTVLAWLVGPDMILDSRTQLGRIYDSD